MNWMGIAEKSLLSVKALVFLWWVWVFLWYYGDGLICNFIRLYLYLKIQYFVPKYSNNCFYKPYDAIWIRAHILQLLYRQNHHLRSDIDHNF